MECPWCGKKERDLARLARHIVRHHSTRLDHWTYQVHIRNRALTVMPYDRVYCWCGAMEWVFQEGLTFEDWLAVHWEKKGGLEAHILEVALEVAQ